MSTADTFEIRPGDTLVHIESILKRKGTDGILAVRDLTSTTSVKFSMVNRATGVTVIDEDSASIVTAADGIVRYSFSAEDIATPGVYNYTWREYVSTATTSYPVRPFDGTIWIHGANQTAEEAYDEAVEAL